MTTDAERAAEWRPETGKGAGSGSMLHVKYLLDSQRWGVFVDDSWPVYPPVATFDTHDAALVAMQATDEREQHL